jgi:hypothetical protein
MKNFADLTRGLALVGVALIASATTANAAPMLFTLPGEADSDLSASVLFSYAGLTASTGRVTFNLKGAGMLRLTESSFLDLLAHDAPGRANENGQYFIGRFQRGGLLGLGSDLCDARRPAVDAAHARRPGADDTAAIGPWPPRPHDGDAPVGIALSGPSSGST